MPLYGSLERFWCLLATVTHEYSNCFSLCSVRIFYTAGSLFVFGEEERLLFFVMESATLSVLETAQSLQLTMRDSGMGRGQVMSGVMITEGKQFTTFCTIHSTSREKGGIYSGPKRYLDT